MKNSIEFKHLRTLYNFVCKEIAYHEAIGDLLRGELTADDAVDATVVRAYEIGDAKPASDVDRWLIQLATEYLESEVKRLKAEREKVVHIEEDVPETPPIEEVSTLGDEILDFYQPDEDLKLEDVIPDLETPSPEEEAENRELQRQVARAIGMLPRAWRNAVVLHYVEGRPIAEVAGAAGTTEDEVKRHLEYARQYLRENLTEAGLRFKRSDKAESKANVDRRTA